MTSRRHTVDDFATGTEVKFPLQAEGEVWYTGWDIPGHWAVDAAGKVFADFGAHGCCMRAASFEYVIRELDGAGLDDQADSLRKMCGRKPRLPPWIGAAIASGWQAPSGFKREDYE